MHGHARARDRVRLAGRGRRLRARHARARGRRARGRRKGRRAHGERDARGRAADGRRGRRARQRGDQRAARRDGGRGRRREARGRRRDRPSTGERRRRSRAWAAARGSSCSPAPRTASSTSRCAQQQEVRAVARDLPRTPALTRRRWLQRLEERDVRFALSCADSDEMSPCAAVEHEPKRSASVVAQPSCMSGVRHPTPTSGGTWNAPPVPTSTVALLVSFVPEWQLAHVVVGALEESASEARGLRVDPRRRGGRRDRLHPARQRAHLVGRPVARRTCAACTRCSRGSAGWAGRRASDKARCRRWCREETASVAALVVEDPHVPVVSAFGVARGAGDLRSRLRVEHVVARVVARRGRELRRSEILPAGERHHPERRGLSRLDEHAIAGRRR